MLEAKRIMQLGEDDAQKLAQKLKNACRTGRHEASTSELKQPADDFNASGVTEGFHSFLDDHVARFPPGCLKLGSGDALSREAEQAVARHDLDLRVHESTGSFESVWVCTVTSPLALNKGGLYPNWAENLARMRAVLKSSTGSGRLQVVIRYIREGSGSTVGVDGWHSGPGASGPRGQQQAPAGVLRHARLLVTYDCPNETWIAIPRYRSVYAVRARTHASTRSRRLYSRGSPRIGTLRRTTRGARSERSNPRSFVTGRMARPRRA